MPLNISISELLAKIPQSGMLNWIGLRPQRRGEVTAVEAVEVLEGRGLEGDHTSLRTANLRGKRHVTLIQAEHLPVIASLAGLDEVTPQQLRRNLVISGINLIALKDKRFKIGDVLLEGTGYCHPCSRMETTLGPGGYNAMRGHGGITARVLAGGPIRLGDRVVFQPDEEEPPSTG